MAASFPYPGVGITRKPNGTTVLRLHYTADPDKSRGEAVYVPELNMKLTPWAKKEFDNMTNKSLYRQEYEIDGSATLGSLVFYLEDEATLEKSFPIPEHWTRYFSLDPHPAVAHAGLWGAVDPYGDLWIYREFWPADECFRYERGVLVGKPGPCSDDKPPCRIKDYVGAMRFLESNENPQNRDAQGRAFTEEIKEREIDYAARAFGQGTQDDEKQDNYQVRFEQHMSGRCKCNPKCERISKPEFRDAKKSRNVGEELVNEWLKPRDVDDGKDGWRKKSRLHIFSDRCPELIYQLKNNRRQQLTALQAETQDPTGKPVQVRKHMTDNLLYMVAADPKYHALKPTVQTHSPMAEGFSY